MAKTSSMLVLTACFLVADPVLAGDAHLNDMRVTAAPAGASVTLGLRMPLGAEKQSEQRAIVGLTASYGMHFEDSQKHYRVRTRQVELAQLNFDNAGVRDLQLANFSLTQFGRHDITTRKLNLSAGETVLVVGGVALAVVAITFLSTSDEDFNWMAE
jgi:hypothetical protein